MMLTCQPKCFFDKIESLFNLSFPLLSKQISSKRLNNPWLSPAILTSIKHKNHLFKLSKSSLISRSYYNRYRNRLTALIRHSKRIYFKSTFDKYKTDIKKKLGRA